jgi:hypothetical protein
MWCRLKNEKGNYQHNLYGYLFDLKCVGSIDDIDDYNPHWREFEDKEDAMGWYNVSFKENALEDKEINNFYE